MLDLSQFGTVAGLAVIIGLLVQFTKPQLPTGVLPWLPWIACLLGAVLAVIDGIATGQATQALAQLALTGVLGGLTATGLYQGTVDALKPKAP